MEKAMDFWAQKWQSQRNSIYGNRFFGPKIVVTKVLLESFFFFFIDGIINEGCGFMDEIKCQSKLETFL